MFRKIFKKSGAESNESKSANIPSNENPVVGLRTIGTTVAKQTEEQIRLTSILKEFLADWGNHHLDYKVEDLSGKKSIADWLPKGYLDEERTLRDYIGKLDKANEVSRRVFPVPSSVLRKLQNQEKPIYLSMNIADSESGEVSGKYGRYISEELASANPWVFLDFHIALAKVPIDEFLEQSPILLFINRFPDYLQFLLGSLAFGSTSEASKVVDLRRDKFFRVLNDLGEVQGENYLETMKLDLSLVPCFSTAIPGHTATARKTDLYVESSALHVFWRHGNSKALTWVYEELNNGRIPRLLSVLVELPDTLRSILSRASYFLMKSGKHLGNTEVVPLSRQIRYVLNEHAKDDIYPLLRANTFDLSARMVEKLDRHKSWFEKIGSFSETEVLFLFSFILSDIRLSSPNLFENHEVFNYSLLPSLEDLHNYVCLRSNENVYRHLRLWCRTLSTSSSLETYRRLMGGMSLKRLVSDKFSAKIFISLFELYQGANYEYSKRADKIILASIMASLGDKNGSSSWLAEVSHETIPLDGAFGSEEGVSQRSGQTIAASPLSIALRKSRFDFVDSILREARNINSASVFEKNVLAKFRKILIADIDQRWDASLPIPNIEYDKLVRLALELSPRPSNPFWHFFQ